MARRKGHKVEISLDRLPGNASLNWVKIDGKKLEHVTRVEVVGQAGGLPQVKIELLPLHVDAIIGNFEPVISRPVLKNK